VVVQRFEVYLVSLDPTVGSEIQKSRPCLAISPNEMNRHINTVIVAPMTTQGRAYPTRVPYTFQGRQGQVVLDQSVRWIRAGSSQNVGGLAAKLKGQC
jgi:mRNA interferase MazF